MIPKIIHFCWFGNKKKPKLVLDCITSWKTILPNYEIIEWNESNTNLDHDFVKEVYRLRKWAFVSDFIRLQKLYEFGGIYLDTDMMLIKSIDDLLDDVCFLGAEEEYIISAGIIGAQKNNNFIDLCLKKYNFLKIHKTTDFNELAIPLLLTKTFVELYGKHNFNLIFSKNNITIYPVTYFYPLPNRQKKDIQNYINYIEKNTYAVHLWNASWVVPTEFDYIRDKKYALAIKTIINVIFIQKKINLEYLKKIIRHSINSFHLTK